MTADRLAAISLSAFAGAPNRQVAIIAPPARAIIDPFDFSILNPSCSCVDPLQERSHLPCPDHAHGRYKPRHHCSGYSAGQYVLTGEPESRNCCFRAKPVLLQSLAGVL